MRLGWHATYPAWTKLGDRTQECDNTGHLLWFCHFKRHFTKKRVHKSQNISKIDYETDTVLVRGVGVNLTKVVPLWSGMCLKSFLPTDLIWFQSMVQVGQASRVLSAWQWWWVAVCAVFFWHRQVEVCTIILCSGLLHAVRINNTKHVSAVILSAVDDRTMRNHQPLGTYSKGCVHTQSDVLGIMLSHYIDHILELWVTWQTGLPGKCEGFARVLRSVLVQKYPIVALDIWRDVNILLG